MTELKTLELECGVTLELQPVKSTIVLELIGDLGGFDNLSNMTADSFSDQAQAVTGFVRLLNYFAGWGVKNDPPQDVADDFAALGGGKRIVRSRWVRDIATEDEVSQLFAQVMALTFAEQKQQPPDDETEQLKARIAELEAQQTGE